MKRLPSRRTLLVVGIALLAVLWIVSGTLRRAADTPSQVAQRGLMAVAVESRQAQPVQRILTLQGQVEPDQLVIVRAETAGRIESWQVERGAAVGVGEEIARLSIDDREARRRQALARVRERRENYRAIRQLVEEGFAAPQEEQVRLTELQAARAELEAIEQEIAHTRIAAPIAGMFLMVVILVPSSTAFGPGYAGSVRPQGFTAWCKGPALISSRLWISSL